MDIIETAKLEEHMENQTGDPANTYTRPAEPAEEEKNGNGKPCLLYTSDAADDWLVV